MPDLVSSKIYDNPVPYMTVEDVFRYMGIDIIPLGTDGGNSSSFFFRW